MKIGFGITGAGHLLLINNILSNRESIHQDINVT